MKILKFLKNSYLFLILFFLFIFKDSLYKIIKVDKLENSPICDVSLDEYNKLLQFSKINYTYNTDYFNTLIIYKDIYEYMNEITIRGGKDYNFNSNPVIYNNTLIGFIDEVDNTSSIVKLITSNDSKVSVKIGDVVGLLQYKDQELIVSNISNYSNINIGDKIYTSGLGKVKENIFIGTVKDIILTNKDIEQVIKVNYDIDIKNINYVTVMKETIS